MREEIGAKWFELIFLANCGEARPPLLLLLWGGETTVTYIG